MKGECKLDFGNFESWKVRKVESEKVRKQSIFEPPNPVNRGARQDQRCRRTRLFHALGQVRKGVTVVESVSRTVSRSEKPKPRESWGSAGLEGGEYG